VRYTVSMILSVIWLFGAGTLHAAHADGLTRATGAYARGDYVRAAHALSLLARRGNAHAQALLGFYMKMDLAYRRPMTPPPIFIKELPGEATSLHKPD
jgi:hypothetical protein